MRLSVLSVSLLIGFSAAALSQPAPNAADPGYAPGRGGVAQRPLPSPPGGDEQRPSAYLQAAQGALAAGRLGEVREALEMAQTRLLDRSVPLGQTNNPADNPAVMQISQALQALAARDRATCMQQIQAAIGLTTAQGF